MLRVRPLAAYGLTLLTGLRGIQLRYQEFMSGWMIELPGEVIVGAVGRDVVSDCHSA